MQQYCVGRTAPCIHHSLPTMAFRRIDRPAACRWPGTNKRTDGQTRSGMDAFVEYLYTFYIITKRRKCTVIQWFTGLCLAAGRRGDPPTYLPTSRGTRVWTLDGHGSKSMSLGNVTLDTDWWRWCWWWWEWRCRLWRGARRLINRLTDGLSKMRLIASQPRFMSRAHLRKNASTERKGRGLMGRAVASYQTVAVSWYWWMVKLNCLKKNVDALAESESWIILRELIM